MNEGEDWNVPQIFVVKRQNENRSKVEQGTQEAQETKQYSSTWREEFELSNWLINDFGDRA